VAGVDDHALFKGSSDVFAVCAELHDQRGWVLPYAGDGSLLCDDVEHGVRPRPVVGAAGRDPDAVLGFGGDTP